MNAINSTDSILSVNLGRPLGGEPGLTALEAHAQRCVQSRSPLFTLRCAMESLHGFLVPRFVTTLALAALLLALCGLA